MTEKRRPWMKFYPADWQADEGLKQCSLAARGLWIEMIAVMHKSTVYGHLLIAGVKPTDAQLAKQVSGDAKAVGAAIAELEGWGVFSRTPDGVIFSRRMLEDEKKDKANRENGGRGGNPALTGNDRESVKQGVNPPVNAVENGADKAQRPEAREKKEEPPSLRSVPPPMPRGSRLPSDWSPTPESRRYAAEQGLNPDTVAANFRDYWCAKAGKDAVKTDWPATWRMWCRRDAERQANAPKPKRVGLEAAYEAAGLFAEPPPPDPWIEGELVH